MRYILKVVRAVERLYNAMDKETALFRESSGLGCSAGCSRCCTYPGIKTSVLEMLPLAWHLYSWNLHEEILKKVEEGGALCAVYDHLVTGKADGRCLFYLQRPLICRLFGFSGMVVRHDRLAMYTCKTIKSEHPGAYRAAEAGINSGRMKIPFIQRYQFQLDAIDYTMAGDINPINESLHKALHKVSFHFRKRNKTEIYRHAG